MRKILKNTRCRRWRLVLLAGVLGSLAGACAHTPAPTVPEAPAPEPAADPRLERATALYEAGEYNAALLECVTLSQQATQMPGLDNLRLRVLAALMEREARDLAERSVVTGQRIANDSLVAAQLPDTYGAQRAVESLPVDQLSPESPMREVLATPVTIQLKGANLGALIAALSADPNINIVADHGLGQEQQLDIEVQDVPLRELLQYIERNLGVRFFLGDHVIWVTNREASGAAPLDTRVFRLRQGFQMHGDAWGEAAKDQGAINRLTHMATVLSTGDTYIEQVIAKMVPEQAGAMVHFDRNTHTLFVRNTRENIEIIARIVEALDVNPPQVLIEARFIEVTVGDLRELGISWMLNSPWALTKKAVMEDGRWQRRPEIQVGDGSTQYSPFVSSSGGPHPLGPQGAFGLFGNPPTDVQGLTLSIEGVLTEPLFEAVLHALEISGKGRTLSMPRVTTQNNTPAKLRSGSDLRYFEQFQAQAFNLVDADNKRYTVTVLIPSGAPSIEELGITLLAVPSVGADRRAISLLLNPSISELEGFVSYQDEGSEMADDATQIRQVVAKLPIFMRREVATKLTVQSGETVVLGGLIDTIEQDTVHKVPLLGDLPLIGGLFRRTGVTEQRRNLLIFVTATVISDTGVSLLSNYPAAPVALPSLRPGAPSAAPEAARPTP
ncbi:MAG: hypothetical protein K9N49_09035 [Candidatus Marinimicrobia bacterium]|nr:hypothetical protein [Candidatus Neomarinimicrobiota bacterium]